MNSIGYFEIQANDPEKVIAFYTKIFGWKFVEAKGLPIKYWQIETNGIRGGLLERPMKTPPTEFGTNAYTCSIEVENFDETAKTILTNDGQVAMPKFLIPGRCWQGYFLDPDNNVFGIFEIIN
ncbi:MAG TPA: VOC family protein [Pyrinomonadaceae bacterium]|nr:VOC family protein [Pyrinomonadaceae bacterium]